MRSRAAYHAAHLVDSISFPVDLCNEEFFSQWNPSMIEREIIKNKEKLNLFKNRRRMFISIIAGNEELQTLIQVLPMLFKNEHLSRFKECPVYKGKKIALEDVSRQFYTYQIIRYFL
jgi:hypothetical protein